MTSPATSRFSGGGAPRPLNMGLIGIGVGGARVLASMDAMTEVNLVAAADVDEAARARFLEDYSYARAYANAEQLCADPEIEAVWISTPNRFHAEHTALAAEHGKHVIVEKPMALTLEEAAGMVEVAEKNGVKLMAGHTWSYNVPMRAIRRIVCSGKLGGLRAMNVLSYTDWMLRPRVGGELEVAEGGGIPYRQGPHQVDTVRMIGGGMLRSVRAMTGQWMRERSVPGYYAAYLEFADATPVTIVHNGYGYFIGAELVPWGESRHAYSLDQRVAVRRSLASGVRDELVAKQDRRDETIVEERAARAGGRRPWIPRDLGVIIVSCERGDIRQSKWGLSVYDDDGITEVELDAEGGSHGSAEIRELYDAIVAGKPIYHDGAWGMATLEVVLAIMESAKQRREIELHHQVPMDPTYDSDLSVGYLG